MVGLVVEGFGYVFEIHKYLFSEKRKKVLIRFQDPVNARFEPCVLPFISVIPAVVTICILLGLALRLLPMRKVIPKWLRTFIHEIPEEQDEFLALKRRKYTTLSGTLLAVSLLGLILQTISVFHPKLRLGMIFPAASWGISSLMIAFGRPASTPKALLVLYTSIFATQAIVLIDQFFETTRDDIPAILAFVASFGAIMTILHMPLRDPNLPNERIAPAFGPPTKELRSPEDNLTLWQFMTISWMKPLIYLGNSRQLNDEDVWMLSYEFQHRILHDRFRELKGSVLRRLIEANGVDLFIISVLAIIELFASLSLFFLHPHENLIDTCLQTFRHRYFCRRFFRVWKITGHRNVQRSHTLCFRLS